LKSTVLISPKFEGKKMIFGKFKELFFVGIGGSGMSGIAEILHNLGYRISGSDISFSEVTQHLESLGIKVYDRHDASNLGTANVVVISSAIKEANPEIIEARAKGIPVIKRAEMLGELMRLKYSIGVSGTHGKTTTTSMIGKIMTDAGLDPTLIVGGIVAGKGSGASLGAGDYLVAEADEYDRSFLSMFPSMAVITNIEPDHLECYDGMEDLESSFLTYMNRVPFYGMVVYSADDPVLAKLHRKITRASVSFGYSSEADYQAVDIAHTRGGAEFTVFKRSEHLGRVVLNIPGEHNVRNALASVTATSELEVSFETIAKSLKEFRGVGRRFEIKATIGDIMIVDDYAHHPTEITASLEAARKSYGRRIVLIFQPHLFSRTQILYREFAEALRLADICWVVDIYPAREEPINGVTAELITRYAAREGYDHIQYVGMMENAVARVLETARSGDMVITMGAGSITRINPEIIGGLKGNDS
jgi:UDP-N-acetylmuramate--alanine ligase